jgi:uncharacterized protein (DUF1800 family)
MIEPKKTGRPRDMVMPAVVAASLARNLQSASFSAALPSALERAPLRHKHSRDIAPATPLPMPLPEVHLLNRAAFCYTEADLNQVRALGVEAWIEEQLQPDSIEDGAVDSWCAKNYPALRGELTALLRRRNSWKTIYELRGNVIHRALFSRRRLFERMVEFWSDHFSIYVWDDFGPPMKIVDDRDVIRAHALGKFRDLLRASAHSPAMITYLDNHYNTKDGPNENYAREFLELHAMGADRGYTQKDVEEVARCFTGLSISWKRNSYGRLEYHPWDHDDGAKTVLGAAIPAGLGVGDVDRVVDIVAAHPSTAGYIAEKLCRRFVSDSPPATLVARVAQEFADTDGDIPALLRMIFSADEFWNSADQKMKRPFEFLITALNVTGAAFDKDRDEALGWYLYLMEHAPFEWVPPNGYPDVGAAWGSTNGLLARWNFALWLAQGWLGGVKPVTQKLIAASPGKSAIALVDYLSERFLRRALSAADREKLIVFAAAGKDRNAPLDGERLYQAGVGLVALLLNGPYFQYK